MRLAVRELRRRPGRFGPVAGALTLLVLLLLVLGGFLDGLTLGQTGSYRAQTGRLYVLAEDAERQLSRSLVTPDEREAVAQVDGVAAVGGLARLTTTAGVPDQPLEDVVVYGYEQPTDVLPAPPGDDGVVVDRRLARLSDVAVGDPLAVGPDGAQLEVVGLVDDVSEGAPTLWVSLATWRTVAASASPTGPPPASAVQALVVTPTAGTGVDDLAAALEDAAPVEAATVDEVTAALDVVVQQAATFQGIIGVTFVVALLVVALFFALLTLERVRLYAVLKAVGARTWDLVVGVTTQAVGVAAVALLLGGALAVGFVALLPPELPVQLVPGRVAVVAAGTLLTALAGGLFTLRRLLRVDPARALG
jgi:putative ABC transport system permease protein